MAVHFAWLTELSPNCRREAAVAMSGHAVLQTGLPQPYVHVRLHGLRRLHDRRPPGVMFYEAWHVPSDGTIDAAVSVGLLNANDAGDAVADLAWPSTGAASSDEALPGTLLLITAQRNDGVLRPSDEAVLLGVIGPAATLPAVVAFGAGASSPAGTAAQAPTSTGTPAPAGSAAAASAIQDAGPVAAAPPQPLPLEKPEPVAVYTPEPVAEVSPVPVKPSEPALSTAPATAPTPAPPAARSTPGWTFPASLADVPRTCPPGHRLLTEAGGALIPLLPDLRSTTGNMTIHFERGQCLVTIRGAPNPADWGVDPLTRRPFNVYQAWLRRTRGDETAPLGFFRRIHHDTYRLHYRGRLPLHAFDTVAVTAADRANATFGSGPLLYVATYSHSEPVPGAGPR